MFPPSLPAFAQASSPAAAAPSSYTLRYKWATGQVLAYHFTMDTDGTLTGGPSGQSVPLQQHMEAIVNEKVTDVRASDGAATLALFFQPVTLSVNGNDVPLPGDQATPMKSVGTMVISPAGKVLSENFAATDQMGMMPGMNSMMFQSNGNLPDGPVKTGDTWNTTANAALAVAQVSAVNTLASVDSAGGAHNADIKSTIKGTFDPDAPSSASLPMRLGGTMTGTIEQHFDIDAGKLVSQQSSADLDLALTPRDQGGAMGPMKMKMTVHTSTHPASPSDATAPPATPTLPATP